MSSVRLDSNSPSTSRSTASSTLAPSAGNTSVPPGSPSSSSTTATTTARTPLPTAKQALTKIFSEDDSKRSSRATTATPHTSRHPHSPPSHRSQPPHAHPHAPHRRAGHRHRHTHSLGLLSPTASASASSSSSYTSLISEVQGPLLRSTESSRSFSSDSLVVSNCNRKPQEESLEDTHRQEGDSSEVLGPARSSPSSSSSHTHTHTHTRSASTSTPTSTQFQPHTPTPPRSHPSSNLHSNSKSNSSSSTSPPPSHTPTHSPFVQRLLQPLFGFGRFSTPSSPTTCVTPLSSSAASVSASVTSPSLPQTSPSHLPQTSLSLSLNSSTSSTGSASAYTHSPSSPLRSSSSTNTKTKANMASTTIHQPSPQAYQPPSPTATHHTLSTSQSSNPPSNSNSNPPSHSNSNPPSHPKSHPNAHSQRPPSRSEKLLRDALLRDEMERHGHGLGGVPPLPQSPLAGSSFGTSISSPHGQVQSPTKGHRRRHSHVPTTTTLTSMSGNGGATPAHPTQTLTHTQPHTPNKMQDSEDYIRGSSLFRTAMSNPRSVSPPLRGPVDAVASSPILARGGQHQQQQVAGRHAHQGSVHQASPSQLQQGSGSLQQAAAQSPHQHMPLQTQTPRRHGSQVVYGGGSGITTGTGRSTSHSPSPMTRRALGSTSTSAAAGAHTTNANANASKSPATSPRSPPATLQRHHTSPSSHPQAHQSPSTPSAPSGRQRSTTTGVKSRPPPIDLFNSSSSSSEQRQKELHHAYQRTQAQLPAYTSPGPGLAGSSTHASPPLVSGPGEPLLMTPHEQVLRARLERVLEQGRVVEKREREREERRRSKERGESGSRSGSSRRGGGGGGERASVYSYGNEVRDEEGGWPWRQGVAPSVTSSGQYSSPSSGSAGSKPSHQSQAAAFLNAFSHPQSHPQSHPHPQPQPPRTPSGMHNRTRSKTDPVSPPPAPGASSRSAAPSPRRSSTAPTPASCLQGTPSKRQQQQRQQHRERTGTTPPLTSEGDGDGDGDGQEEDGQEDGELRLLTPPPTPPFTARIFSLSTPQSQRHGEHAHLGGHHQRAVTMGGGDYLPSPYKTSYGAHVQQLPAHLQQQQQGKKGLSGLGMGLPPSSRRRVSPADDDEEDDEDEDGSSSCSSHHHHRSNPSQASFPSSRSSQSNSPLRTNPTKPEEALSPPANLNRLSSRPSSPPRPQFNARKASVQCRAMQGYVSFASVEGLGEPPRGVGEDTEEGGDGQGEGEKRGREKERGVLGAWGSGLRKLLGVAGVQGGGGKEGVVL